MSDNFSDDLIISTKNQHAGRIITQLSELLAILALDAKSLGVDVAPDFALKVPYAFVQKMQKGDKNDPLLRQVLPIIDEKNCVQGYELDPLQEKKFNTIKGLLHKYPSRVLITLTGACMVHCRYCFRQHFDYGANLPDDDTKAQIIDYINKNQQINEIILSGGDPLSLSNRRLFLWLDAFCQTHVATIRLHTRVPIVNPCRIDDELLDKLAQLTLQKNIIMVVHTNHANEIDEFTKNILLNIKKTGVTLLNQTVLLKGVNDNVNTLVNLSHRLFESGVLPYYLHILDKVQGSAHFDVPVQKAIELYWAMLGKLSGYLVPKLVQELPNCLYKTPIDIYKQM